MNSGTPVNKILILAAHPLDMSRLRLEAELRDIEEGLQRAKKTRSISLKASFGSTPPEIFTAKSWILSQRLSIFSGHGEGEGGLVFEDVTGKAKLVDAEALALLFEYFAHVKCVVLNACYSEFQAKAIAQHIDYVIGMSQAIGDRAAIEFAVGFYDGLGAGRSFEDAYKLGCIAIRMAGIPEHLTPKLLRKNLLGTEGANTTPSNFADTVEVSTSDNLSSECGIDYTRLRNLLAAGKWREADQETNAVMLKAAGTEKEDCLSSESIQNFPCTDLRTIDQLWVKYSGGHFGFSVQKRIWESEGKDIGKYADRLGWRKGKFFWNWLSYNQLTFSTNAPLGHLPAFWGVGEVGWLFVGCGERVSLWMRPDL